MIAYNIYMYMLDLVLVSLYPPSLVTKGEAPEQIVNFYI